MGTISLAIGRDLDAMLLWLNRENRRKSATTYAVDEGLSIS